MPHAPDPKSEALRRQGTLNARPQDILDQAFRGGDFFDPRDLVQVKYEMLRRVQVDGLSITEAARVFGFSRPAFYQAQVSFQLGGLPGLIPRRPGPRHAHKLSDHVIDFILQEQLRDPTLHSPALVQRIQEQFDLSVHPRSIERALGRRLKKGR
jgi:transposase